MDSEVFDRYTRMIPHDLNRYLAGMIPLYNFYNYI